MKANLNKDLDMTFTLCHSVSLCMCVCARRWCPPTFLLLCYDWRPRSKPTVNRRCHPHSTAIGAVLAASCNTDRDGHTFTKTLRLNVCKIHTPTHSNVLLIRHSASIENTGHAHASSCLHILPALSVLPPAVGECPCYANSEQNAVRDCKCVSVHLTGAEGCLPLSRFPIFLHFRLIHPQADSLQLLNSTEADIHSPNIYTSLFLSLFFLQTFIYT